MPLLDHFRPPLSIHHPWQSIHSAWANAMVRRLNEGLLPERYYALPNVRPGGRMEIDVATIDRGGAVREADSVLATAIQAPAAPTLSIPVVDAEVELFEVQVLDAEEGQLVAALELVSPANKDRPETRRALGVKGAALLQQGVSFALIDVVTRRAGSLHSELLDLLIPLSAPHSSELGLSAAEYRLIRDGAGARLECWMEELSVGAELPVLPVWLAPDLSVPLDLELTYTAMCQALRLHE